MTTPSFRTDDLLGYKSVIKGGAGSGAQEGHPFYGNGSHGNAAATAYAHSSVALGHAYRTDESTKPASDHRAAAQEHRTAAEYHKAIAAQVEHDMKNAVTPLTQWNAAGKEIAAHQAAADANNKAADAHESAASMHEDPTWQGGASSGAATQPNEGTLSADELHDASATATGQSEAAFKASEDAAHASGVPSSSTNAISNAGGRENDTALSLINEASGNSGKK